MPANAALSQASQASLGAMSLRSSSTEASHHTLMSRGADYTDKHPPREYSISFSEDAIRQPGDVVSRQSCHGVGQQQQQQRVRGGLDTVSRDSVVNKKKNNRHPVVTGEIEFGDVAQKWQVRQLQHHLS